MRTWPRERNHHDRCAVELSIDAASFHDAFAGDVSDKDAAVMAAAQRPVAAAAFGGKNGPPAWKKLPAWAVVAAGDKAAGADVVRSMAKRANAGDHAMNQPADRSPGAHTGESSAAIPGMRSKPSLSAAIRQDRRAALVVNTRSRRGRRLYPAILTRLREAGFDLSGSFPASRFVGLGASLAAAMDLQPDLLIVGGGDGSISEAARRLAYRDMALGILPLGTTNNFARTLGIPLKLSSAIDVLPERAPDSDDQ